MSPSAIALDSRICKRSTWKSHILRRRWWKNTSPKNIGTYKNFEKKETARNSRTFGLLVGKNAKSNKDLNTHASTLGAKVHCPHNKWLKSNSKISDFCIEIKMIFSIILAKNVLIYLKKSKLSQWTISIIEI